MSDRVETATRTVRGWVAGRVQRVSYRATLAQQAGALGLTGWVRNLPDGRVEFFAHGRSDRVRALLDWARRGPRLARVEQLYADDVDESPPRAFEIRH